MLIYQCTILIIIVDIMSLYYYHLYSHKLTRHNPMDLKSNLDIVMNTEKLI